MQENGAFVVFCGPDFAVRQSHSGRKDRLFIFTKTIFISLFSLNRFIFEKFLFSFSFTVYTFENPSHLSAFVTSSPATLKLTTTRYKDAKHSMKWTWTSGATITHSFTSNVSIFFI